MHAISLYAKPSATFADKLSASQALLRQAAAQYSPLSQACSLGAEDMVVTHLLAQGGIDCAIFVLDTGKLHASTLALITQMKARYGRTVLRYQPDPLAAAQFEAQWGEDVMRRSVAGRKACCALRKLEPLSRALSGQQAWITGLRKEQSGARADVPAVELETLEARASLSASDASAQPTTRAKINPLADWTWGDVWHYIAEQGLAYHPLHDAFYPSIGCEPCTRAVTPGEDFRSGRWWWEEDATKECGLHVKSASASAAVTPLASAHRPVSKIDSTPHHP